MGAGAAKAQTGGTKDVIVVDAGNRNDMKDGEMKEVQIDEKNKALLIRDKDKFFAIGSKCSHYGAALVTGSYCEGRVRCPWHGACFNVATGDIEEYPGFDSIHKFEVEEEDGGVKIRVRRSQLTNFRRKVPTVNEERSSRDHVLIIGGGPAAVTCAETLRQQGYLGAITICSNEKHAPYNRILLSKNLNMKPAESTLKSLDFYKEKGIVLKLQREAVSVNCEAKEVKFADGSTENYTKLVIATGSAPVRPPSVVSQHSLVLREPSDAQQLQEKAKGSNVIIVGSSFIALELAAALKGKCDSATVIGRSGFPFQRLFGEQVGKFTLKVFEAKGLAYRGRSEIKDVITEGESLKAVKLNNGDELPADIIVAATGVKPNTEFLEGSGIKLNDAGFVTVDKTMRTSDPDVLAVGDLTEFPLFLEKDKHCNVQHWAVAQMQGRVAAMTIADKENPIHTVPFFWSTLFGKNIRYCGYGANFDDVVFHGDEENEKFVAFYCKGDAVVAVSSLNYDPLVSAVANQLHEKRTIKKSSVTKDPWGWK